MVKNNNFRLIFLFVSALTTTAAEVGGASWAKDGRRPDPPHYESTRRLSQEYLKDVAQRDFGTMVKLLNLTGSGSHQQHRLGLSESLSAIAQMYLNDFAYGKISLNNKDDEINMADYVKKTITNPVAILRMIHRVAYFLYYTNKEPDSIPGLPVYSLNRELDRSKFPLKQDLEDAAVGILNIHFIYDLNATDLAAGKVRGIEMGTKLLATQCFYLGVAAKLTERFTLAVDWLREAKRLAMIDGTASISTIQTDLVEVIQEHDEQWKDMESFTTPHFFFTKPLKSLHVAYEANNVRGRTVLENKYAGKGRSCSYWPMNAWGLCRSSASENLRMPKASSHLFCWWEFEIHKTFVIGPLNMEFLSRNPDIVKIHEAFPANNGTGTVSSAMTEAGINTKIEAMTGLKSMQPSASDPVQLVSHTPGGHNKDVHVDSVEHDFPSTTDGGRIATFLIYMNTVEDGGQTVFPAALATTSVPTKGSAIFWFNTFSDGSSPDLSTAHADCPVVLGEHLVAYKWIRFYDQFSTRRCLLQPKERFQVHVNGKVLPVPSALKHKVITEKEWKDAKQFVETSKEDIITNVRRKYAHTPTSSLKATMQLEWEIYQNVKRIFIARQNISVSLHADEINNVTFQENQLILRYLQDFNEAAYNSIRKSTATTMDRETMTKLAGNPLAVYRTFWRFENYVKKLMMIAEIRDLTANVYDQSDGPSWTDLQDAMTGILLIQSVHHFESYDIADGFLAGRDIGIILTARQCIELGHQAIASTLYYEAITWMETALEKVISQADDTVGLKEAEAELETAKKVEYKLTTKSNSLKTNFYVDPFARLNGSSTSMETRVQDLYKSYKKRHEDQSFVKNDWIRVCQGSSHQTRIQERSKQLFCWQETTINPYFRIRPLSAELLSMSPGPEVVLYHNILGERLLAFLRNDTDRSYTESTAGGGTGSATRLSATSSIPLSSSSQEETTGRIMKLANAITGLNIVPERKINIHSYAPGGQFPVHVDSGGPGGEQIIATIIYYVTQPELGGGTAFSQAGVHLTRPKPGSAVFWYNTLNSGEIDHQTYHGGCPVIFGEKRVVGQYIYYRDQYHLQCGADPMSRIEILVNGKSKHNLVDP